MLAPYVSGYDTDNLLDRRRHPRRRGGGVKIRVSDYRAEAGSIEGIVLDTSSGGLCVSLPQFVAAGTVLSVRPSSAPEIVPWVHVEIMYCNAREGSWIAGCQFTHLVPWSVRVLFG